MKSQAKKKPYKKIALAVSLCALVAWGVLGTGASLAWFTDASPEISNIFHFADFGVEVSHRLPDGTWESVDGQTTVFDDAATYEPGYVQTVYLKVENSGDRECRLDTAVAVTGFTPAINVFGQSFSLQDHLTFGIVATDTEGEMDAAVSDRNAAKAVAMTRLNRYDTTNAVDMLRPGECTYMALVVRMPETVDNIANYRGDTVPTVDLGIIVTANQRNN